MRLVVLFAILLAALAATICGEEKCDPASIRPEMLKKIIAEQQFQNVKESIDEFICFTDDDLDQFIKNERPAKIAEELKNSKCFQAVVASIKKLPSEERVKFLGECRRPLRPTWRELGRISGSDSQTEAGNRAEKLIAETIVNLAIQLSETESSPGS